MSKPKKNSARKRHKTMANDDRFVALAIFVYSLALANALLNSSHQIIVILLFSGVGLFWLFRCINYTRSTRSLSWPRVKAECIHFGKVAFGGRYTKNTHLVVTYRYIFDDQEFKGTLYSLFPLTSDRPWESLENYRSLKSFEISVNPKKPNQSVEVPGPQKTLWQPLVIICSLLVIGVGVLWKVLIQGLYL